MVKSFYVGRNRIIQDITFLEWYWKSIFDIWAIFWHHDIPYIIIQANPSCELLLTVDL